MAARYCLTRQPCGLFFVNDVANMRASRQTSILLKRQTSPIDKCRSRRAAFSLVELVIVVVIIGVISAVAVPRISNAAKGAKSAALMATLNSVRKAIDVYYAEHNQYPGYTPGTTTPNNTKFIEQLLDYSSATGATNPLGSSTYLYGPYLRPPFPANPFNNLSTVTVKATPAVADPTKGTVGWVAVLSNGAFYVSATTTTLNDIGVVKQDRVDAMLK